MEYVSVYLGSMVKFVLGPLAGLAHDLTVAETAIFSILGMMTTVLIVLLIGTKSRQWLVNKLGIERRIANSSYRTKRLWENYGALGIAFLTPILLSPILGSIIAMMFESSRRKIAKYMLASAIFWGLTISFLFDRLGAAGAAMFGY